MWFALGGVAVFVALGWLTISAVARRLTLDLAYMHEHPMTVRGDEGWCWSCDRSRATSVEGLCAGCAVNLLEAS